MGKKLLCLGVFLCIVSALKLLGMLVLPTKYELPLDFTSSSLTIVEGADRTDAESSFASGKRLSVEELDGYSLSLLPGFSDKLGRRVLDAYRLAPGATGWPSSPSEIHGIGPAKAQQLLMFFDLPDAGDN